MKRRREPTARASLHSIALHQDGFLSFRFWTSGAMFFCLACDFRIFLTTDRGTCLKCMLALRNVIPRLLTLTGAN
jgi:hypothetical protein